MEVDILVEMARKGDKEAFEKLILMFRNMLYRIAKVKMHNEEDICDAVQETILSAYKYIHKLKDITYFKTWLIKILINKCNDFYKRPERNDVSFDAIEYDNWYSNENMESNISFESLISNLNQEERIIMVLHYSEGYKEKEIAEILNINYASLRSKMKRAKDKLLQKLEKEGL